MRAARTVFWEHGFEAASLPALERATGLNRSSIYHGFGSKRGLFDAAVASYLDEVVRPRLRPLVQDDVAPVRYRCAIPLSRGLSTAVDRSRHR